MRSVSKPVPMILVVLLMFAMSASAVAAEPAQGGPIVVVDVQGAVHVSIAGTAQRVRPGSIIGTPATIRTGADGRIELRQGATTASVERHTRIDLPASAAADGLIEHIDQSRGNVLYDVAKRPGRKLRIETPYLVAVVKGTRFNVAAQADSATVALFEGRLEVWMPDDSDVVELNAGEIATRGRGDRAIRVFDMASGESIRAQRVSQGEVDGPRSASVTTSGNGISTTPPEVEGPRSPRASGTNSAPGSSDVLAGRVNTLDASLGSVGAKSAIDATVGVSEIARVGVEVDTELDLDASAGNVPTAGVDLGVEANVVETPFAIDAGVAVGESTAVVAGVGAGPVGVGLDVGLDAGTSTPSLDLGVTAEVPVVPAVEDLVAPLPTVIDDIVAPVPPLVEEVGAPLSPVVEEVVAPLRGLLGP